MLSLLLPKIAKLRHAYIRLWLTKTSPNLFMMRSLQFMLLIWKALSFGDCATIPCCFFFTIRRPLRIDWPMLPFADST